MKSAAEEDGVPVNNFHHGLAFVQVRRKEPRYTLLYNFIKRGHALESHQTIACGVEPDPRFGQNGSRACLGLGQIIFDHL